MPPNWRLAKPETPEDPLKTPKEFKQWMKLTLTATIITLVVSAAADIRDTQWTAVFLGIIALWGIAFMWRKNIETWKIPGSDTEKNKSEED